MQSGAIMGHFHTAALKSGGKRQQERAAGEDGGKSSRTQLTKMGNCDIFMISYRYNSEGEKI